jgi:glycosyltransferase involved in cell wall biosynthesis
VCNQTYKNLEIIVANDASTDITNEIAKRWVDSDKRIRLINVDNRNVAITRNDAIRASFGKLIAPIDSDDVWHKSKIEKQVRLIVEHDMNLGFIYNAFRMIDLKDNIIKSVSYGDVSGNVLLRHLLFNFVGNGSSLLFPKDVFLAVGGYNESLTNCEDYDLQIRIARHWPVGYVPEYLTGYRISPSNKSGNVDRMLLMHMKVLNDIKDPLSYREKKSIRLNRSGSYIRFGMIQLRRGELAKGFENVNRGFRESPYHSVYCVLFWIRNVLYGRLNKTRTKQAKGVYGNFFNKTPEDTVADKFFYEEKYLVKETRHFEKPFEFRKKYRNIEQ